MTGLDSFVVIDLETTGINPAYNDITELGAALFINGKLKETFSQLVKPAMAIPEVVVKLTGITNTMVKDAPIIGDVIENYQNFINGSQWLVGHNVAFDLGFLKKRITKKIYQGLDKKSLDTAALARALFPRLPRYSLKALADKFNIERKTAHRALSDCVVTGHVYLKLIAGYSELPDQVRKQLGTLLFGSGTGELKPVSGEITESKDIAKTVVSVAGTIGAPAAIEEEYPDNISGELPEESYDDYIQVDSAAVKNHFLAGGLLSQVLPSFEYRSQQAEMAVNICEAFNRSEFLLAEAPTGIGKSIAYLLPASWWASMNHEQVIISTQTKSLQSQLFYKDIPLLQKAVGYRFRAVLLKGRGNYICLYKFHDIRLEAEASFNKKDRQALSPIILWVSQTKTGDISECNGFNPAHNSYLWSRISCEGGFCLGQSCNYADNCFLLKIKRETEKAQIVIVNHHLTFADFASGGDLIRESGHIVFDEAHNLEKIAASYLGRRLEKQALDNLLADMYNTRPVQSGFLVHLKFVVTTQSPDSTLEALVDTVIDSIIGLSNDSNEFFKSLLSKIKTKNEKYQSREISFDQNNNPCGIDEAEGLISSLRTLYDRVIELVEEIREADNLPKKRDVIIRLESFASDVKNFIEIAVDLLSASDPDYVYWIERPSLDRYPPKIYSAPLEVGKLLDEKFYDYLKTAIFSSATLAVDRKFDYIINRLGLDLSQKDRVLTLSLDSPFDIDSEVAVITAGYLPSPRDPDFEPAAVESLQLILSSGVSKAMVLFTSYSSLKNAADTIQDTLKSAGISLFAQDGSFKSDKILHRFKRAKKAVLFGTDSFWEGVDLPGDQLGLLILYKLPFTAPDRPWFKANLKKIEENRGSSFAKLSLPEAVVKFRQGFGRLIRSTSDRGCIVIFDSRVESKSFGKVFLNSVRGKKFRSGSAKDIVGIIKNWHNLNMDNI